MRTAVNRIFRPALIACMAFGVGFLPASGKSTFKVSLDSVSVLMGNLTPLKVTITTDADGVVELPAEDMMPQGVEFSKNSDYEPKLETKEQNGRKLIEGVYMIQAFDSGAYTLPPLMYITEHDTLFSNSVTLKVIPVDVSGMDEINPLDGPMALEGKWYDFLPDWLTDYFLWIVLGLLVIAGGICAYLLLTRKVTVRLVPVKKKRPAYDVAMEKLQQLKGEQLWEKGQNKAFYTHLTEILREYLDDRFGINAMEMTSSQIMNALHSRKDLEMSSMLMEEILRIADIVKFAKVQPTREDNIRAFDDAVKFVEDTRPVEVVETDLEKVGRKETAPSE